jgi:GTP:adenosylcobinamide-phosphate guanylyltransferase
MIDAILLAGGVPQPDSDLYPYTQGKPKAALEIGGKKLLQWVLDALEHASTIQRVVVVGCEDLEPDLNSSKAVRFLPAGEDMLLNFKAGADAILEIDPTAESVAIVSSDIPLITPPIIDWVINQTQDRALDIYYFVIEQSAMEETYPESGRSYTRLKDQNICGGDISVIKLDLYTQKKEFWNKLVEARKSSYRQASLIGVDILLQLVLRRLTLDELVIKVTRRLKISGKGLICPYPEVGMDIDKPHQLAVAQKALGHE